MRRALTILRSVEAKAVRGLKLFLWPSSEEEEEDCFYLQHALLSHTEGGPRVCLCTQVFT